MNKKKTKKKHSVTSRMKQGNFLSEVKLASIQFFFY